MLSVFLRSWVLGQDFTGGGGALPNCCSSQILCWTALNLSNNGLYWHCPTHIPIRSWVLGQDFTRRVLRFFIRHRPLSVYLSLCHITTHMPGFPPPFSHTVSDQNRMVGMRLSLHPKIKIIHSPEKELYVYSAWICYSRNETSLPTSLPSPATPPSPLTATLVSSWCHMFHVSIHIKSLLPIYSNKTHAN